MKRITRLIGIAIISAACASAQTIGEQIDAELVALQARLTELEALPHVDHTAELDAIRARLDALEAQTIPPDLSAELAALEARVDSAEATIADHEARISALEASPPPDPVCGNNILEAGEECDDGNLIDGDGCSAACTVEPSPAGDLASGIWTRYPNSAMDTVYVAGVDDVAGTSPWSGIQSAWSGGVCIGSEIFVWGGGHQDSAHNGLLAFDVLAGTWRRVTEPSPAPALPNNGNTGPDGRPVSRHTYGQLVTDGTNLYSTQGAIYNSGFTGSGDRMWRWDGADWTAMSNPPFAGLGSAVYIDGFIYEMVLNHQQKYEVATDTWTVPGNASAPGPHTQIVYASSSDRIYGIGNGSAWVKDPAIWGVSGVTQITPQPPAASSSYPGLTDYPPEDKVLIWVGGPTVTAIDTNDLTWAELALGGDDPGPLATAGTFGRFSYCAGRVVLINGASNDAFWIDTGAAPPPPPAGDFAQRCNGADVVFCDPLDTEGPWGVDAGGTRRLMSNNDGTEGLPLNLGWGRNWRGVNYFEDSGVPRPSPALDTAIKASGTGSLRFTITADFPNGLTDSRGSGAGTFATNWSDDLSQRFGEGDTFYVQYRWRADCNFIYFDCDPDSPTYRTLRRFYGITDGGASTFAKLSIIGTGDIEPTPLNAAYSCTQLEIVTTHGPDHSLAGYHNCGWYEGFSESFGSSNFEFQPPYDDGPECWYRFDGERRRWGHTGPSCFALYPDEWMTVQIKVTIGTWQTDRTGEPNSNIVMWAAREGEPQQLIIDHMFYAHDPREYADQDWSLDGKYGKIWLFPFMTDKDPNESHPDAHVWYDELIVSTSFIEGPT